MKKIKIADESKTANTLKLLGEKMSATLNKELKTKKDIEITFIGGDQISIMSDTESEYNVKEAVNWLVRHNKFVLDSFENEDGMPCAFLDMPK